MVANLCRLCWSFVTKASWWDLLQQLKRLPADSSALPAVLARMDEAVHCERYTPRPAFSLLLSAFKLQLLTGSEDSAARIVCQASHHRDAHTYSCSYHLHVPGCSSRHISEGSGC